MKTLPTENLTEEQLVGVTDELHNRLDIQAKNLLFEFKYSKDNPGLVPVSDAYNLMRLYGYLITKMIFEKQFGATEAVEKASKLFKNAANAENDYVFKGRDQITVERLPFGQVSRPDEVSAIINQYPPGAKIKITIEEVKP
jgi:hypothetical protein